MGHLFDLPAELLVLISKELRRKPSDDNDDRPHVKDLCQLCLTSRNLLRPAQEALYSEFECFYVGDAWKYRIFLRSILANPSLALHVKTLGLGGWADAALWYSGCNRHQYSEKQKRTDGKLFQKAIHDLALQDKVSWDPATPDGENEIYVTLLVLLLPNLQNLFIHAPSRAVILAKALDHAINAYPARSSVPSLQKVETVVYHTEENFPGELAGSVNDLAPFFRLPSIRSISGSSPMTFNAPWPRLPKNPTLKRLSVELSDSQFDRLKDMLYASENLETFVFEDSHPYLKDSGPHNHGFDAQKLSVALSAHRESLRELSITPYAHSVSVLSSLRSFKNLQLLHTEAQCLLKDPRNDSLTEILPPSLQELYLTTPRYDSKMIKPPMLVAKVKELVVSKNSTMPNLRIVGVQDCWNPLTPACLDLEDVCNEAGVAFVGYDIIRAKIQFLEMMKIRRAPCFIQVWYDIEKRSNKNDDSSSISSDEYF
ncbi:MAG: hypothetical protein Q9214_001055 [Letrouitia sp. 1 TL-2023]